MFFYLEVLKFLPDQVDRLLHFLRDIGRFSANNVGWTGGFVKAWRHGSGTNDVVSQLRQSGTNLSGKDGINVCRKWHENVWRWWHDRTWQSGTNVSGKIVCPCVCVCVI